MILVDTSVWVEFFRGKSDPIVKLLSECLDEDQVVLAAPVRLELLSGAPRKQKPLLDRLLSALPLFYPDEATWPQIEEWIEQGLAKGQRFGAMDLLIAAIAKEYDCALWSLDRDFHRMASLGWIKLYSTGE